MITLNGACGKGTLWGTFYLADRESSGKGMIQFGHLDYMIPPCDWFLPPPGIEWHDVNQSAYGPRLATFDIGDIISTSKNSQAWNPCTQTTIRGTSSFRGLTDTLGPYWTKMASNPRTNYYASIENQIPVKSTGTALAVLSGRPCTSSDPKVYGNAGVKVNQSIGASNDDQRYWNADSILPANIAPVSVRSALSSFGTLYRNGQWYGRRTDNTAIVPGNEFFNANWYKTIWDRPNRTTFVRDQWLEFHSNASYTPKDSTCQSGIDYLVESNHRVTTCVVTHVRCKSPGIFYVRYDQTTELSWFGYLFPSTFQGSKKATIKGLELAILIPEPGLTTEFAPDMTKANEYCAYAKPRAKLLYDASIAKQARTAAVMDTTALDSNWIENLAGLKGTLEVVNPLIDGWKAIETGNISAGRDALASAYLVYSYAIAPNIDDYHDVKDNGSRILSLATINRFSRERRRGAAYVKQIPVCATRALTSYWSTLHLELKNNYFSQIWAALEKLGLDPTASQMWDLIPFSFVVDWFGKVGESLKRIDNYNSLNVNRDLLARIESFKVQWPLEEAVINYLFDNTICSNGTPLEYSWYDRRVYSDIGSIDPIAISSDNALTTSQKAQGSALLSLYKKR